MRAWARRVPRPLVTPHSLGTGTVGHGRCLARLWDTTALRAMSGQGKTHHHPSWQPVATTTTQAQSIVILLHFQLYDAQRRQMSLPHGGFCYIPWKPWWHPLPTKVDSLALCSLAPHHLLCLPQSNLSSWINALLAPCTHPANISFTKVFVSQIVG